MKIFVNTKGETCFEVPYKNIEKINYDCCLSKSYLNYENSSFDIKKYQKEQMAKEIGMKLLEMGLLNIKEENFRDAIIIKSELKIIKQDKQYLC